MNTRYKKLALATAVAAGLAGVSQPSQAIVEAVGEGLLVPLVVWQDIAPAGQSQGDVNTIIDVTVPSTIGFDDVANIYTAPHTTPTNPGLTLFPPDPDLPTIAPFNAIHWYWFDSRSVHRLNRAVPVTPDDVVQINWRDAAPTFGGQAGYMVIGTETARSGAAADFDMFGDANLVIAITGNALQNQTVHIPVLPLTDGADPSTTAPATADNNIVYKGQIPTAVSPLISGMRTSYSDGILSDFSVFDLALSAASFAIVPNASIHIIWLDQNQTDILKPNNFVPVDVFDTTELSCSSTVNVPNELNVIWIGTVLDPLSPWNTGPVGAPGWVNSVQQVCAPTGAGAATSGYVRYQLPEYQDDGSLTAEASGVAFSITLDQVGVGTPNRLPLSTTLGHDRGMYK